MLYLTHHISLSFPTRERGLKFYRQYNLQVFLQSFPTRERGLKLLVWVVLIVHDRSFPTRERGLKLPERPKLQIGKRRSPRGNVD